MPPIDLDQNATTHAAPEVREAVRAALEDEEAGNPSSVHAAGRRAREIVERARHEVARLLGASERDLVVFTSGGTEADVLAIVAGARSARAQGRPARLVTSPLEHPAVRGAAELLRREGFEVVDVVPDGAGRLDPERVRRALEPGAALASFALANHELGNLYDVAAFAELARRAGALVHCDAVQALGKVPVGVTGLGVDLLSISAHKVRGPRGVGALWIRHGVELEPLVRAGHQERSVRPGTENVAGIVGLAAAARLLAAAGPHSAAPRVAALRDRLEASVLAVPGARVHGDRAHRVPNTTNVAFAGVPGDVLVAALDLEGVRASTGAACTSGAPAPSPVILALGHAPTVASEAVRLSLGGDTTPAEIDRVAGLLPRLVARARAFLR